MHGDLDNIRLDLVLCTQSPQQTVTLRILAYIARVHFARNHFQLKKGMISGLIFYLSISELIDARIAYVGCKRTSRVHPKHSDG